MRDDNYQEQRCVQPYTIVVDGNVATEAYRRAREYAYGQAERQPRQVVETAPSRYVRREPQQEVKKEQPQKKQQKAAKKGIVTYTARRPILFVLAVLMIVAVVVNILPIVGLVPEYTGAFLSQNDSQEMAGRSLADPVMSLISYLGGDANAEWSEDDLISQSFFRDCFSKIMATDGAAEEEAAQAAEETGDATEDDSATADAAAEEGTDTTKLICYLAMPVIIILFAIITVYLAIKFLMAAFNGKKYKFGFSLLVAILYLVSIGVLTIVWNGFGISEAVGVLASSLSVFGISAAATKAALGFGFYITAAIFVVALILNIFAYKKEKGVKPAKARK